MVPFLQGTLPIRGPVIMGLYAVISVHFPGMIFPTRRTTGTTEQNEYGKQELIQYPWLKIGTKKEPHSKVQLKVMKIITLFTPIRGRGHRGIPIIAFGGHGMVQVFLFHNITLGTGSHEHSKTHGQ